MLAYLVIRVKVTDAEKYQHYLKIVPAVIEKFGGKALVRGGQTEALEGPPETRRIVILEFPTMEKAREFYNSPEYQQTKKLRLGAAVGEIVAVEGVS
jgi:uncharacterized protein (DUF1330 family)